MENTMPWVYVHPDGGIDGEIETQVHHCAYGENAWQTPASLFTSHTNDSLALDCFKLVEGDTPSYNNWCDVDRLLQTITHIAAVYDLEGTWIFRALKYIITFAGAMAI